MVSYIVKLFVKRPKFQALKSYHRIEWTTIRILNGILIIISIRTSNCLVNQNKIINRYSITTLII